MEAASRIINYNLVASLAVVSLSIQTQIQLGYPSQWHVYMFFVFVSTLLKYNQHKIFSYFFLKENILSKHRKNFPMLFMFFWAGMVVVLGLLLSLWCIQTNVLLVLIPVAAITFLYGAPYMLYKGRMVGLRGIPYLKIFLIAFVWSYITVFLPAIHYACSATELAFMFAERFLFIFAITIPFDIRDMNKDAQAGLKTIPLWIGERKSIYLAKALLLVFVCLCGMHYTIFVRELMMMWPLCISAGITFLLIGANAKQIPHYHYGLMDGSLLMQSMLVWLFYINFN